MRKFIEIISEYTSPIKRKLNKHELLLDTLQEDVHELYIEHQRHLTTEQSLKTEILELKKRVSDLEINKQNKRGVKDGSKAS